MPGWLGFIIMVVGATFVAGVLDDHTPVPFVIGFLVSAYCIYMALKDHIRGD